MSWGVWGNPREREKKEKKREIENKRKKRRRNTEREDKKREEEEEKAQKKEREREENQPGTWLLHPHPTPNRALWRVVGFAIRDATNQETEQNHSTAQLHGGRWKDNPLLGCEQTRTTKNDISCQLMLT